MGFWGRLKKGFKNIGRGFKNFGHRVKKIWRRHKKTIKKVWHHVKDGLKTAGSLGVPIVGNIGAGMDVIDGGSKGEGTGYHGRARALYNNKDVQRIKEFTRKRKRTGNKHYIIGGSHGKRQRTDNNNINNNTKTSRHVERAHQVFYPSD